MKLANLTLGTMLVSIVGLGGYIGGIYNGLRIHAYQSSYFRAEDEKINLKLESFSHKDQDSSPLPLPVTELDALVDALTETPGTRFHLYKNDFRKPKDFSGLVDCAHSNLDVSYDHKRNQLLTSFVEVGKKMDPKKDFGAALVNKLYQSIGENAKRGSFWRVKNDLGLVKKVADYLNVETSKENQNLMSLAYQYVETKFKDGYGFEESLRNARDLGKTLGLDHKPYQRKFVELVYKQAEDLVRKKDYNRATEMIGLARKLAKEQGVRPQIYEKSFADIAYGYASQEAKKLVQSLEFDNQKSRQDAKDICQVVNEGAVNKKISENRTLMIGFFPNNEVCRFADEIIKTNKLYGYDNKCPNLVSSL
ncbi:hypothetical protein HQ489_01215 [Candidatus Woesearchaeota archaeon]|nr:hypothetical protein [Candidatus Woesearchaeota archaeon]